MYPFAQLKRRVYVRSSLSGGHLSPSQSREQACPEPDVQPRALQARFQLSSQQSHKGGPFSRRPSWLQATAALTPFRKEGVCWKDIGASDVTGNCCDSEESPVSVRRLDHRL